MSCVFVVVDGVLVEDDGVLAVVSRIFIFFDDESR